MDNQKEIKQKYDNFFKKDYQKLYYDQLNQNENINKEIWIVCDNNSNFNNFNKENYAKLERHPK